MKSLTMKNISIVLSLLLLSLGNAMGQSIDFHRFTLPSGVRVLLHSNPHAPTVSVGLMYRCGLNDQPSILPGVNEVVAKMRINSSRHLEDGEYQDILNTYGGNSSYTVGYDATFFCDNFSSNMLKGAIWLAAEKTAEFAEDVETFDKYMLEVQDENESARQRKTDEDLLYNMVKTVNMRLNPTIVAYSDTMDIDAVQKYELTYFSPDKAVLAISGMIDVDSTAKYVREMFAFLPDINYGPDVSHSLFTVNNVPDDTVAVRRGRKVEIGEGILTMRPASHHVDTVYRRASEPSIIMAWQIPPYSDPQAEVFDFIGTIMCAQGGVLRDALMKEEQKADNVEYIHLPMARASVFAIKVTAANGVSLKELEDVIKRQVQMLKHRSVAPELLRQAVNTSSMSLWQGISTNQGMVRHLASSELMYGNAAELNSKLDRINSITAEEVRKVAIRFLRTDNMKTFYILPGKENK